jgi:mRNA interferase YafQ
MLTIVHTTSFKKDFKKIKKQKKNLELMKDLLLKLSSAATLDSKYKDHLLSGNYKNKRECHITPDWLLIYEINDNELVLYRTGSHAELFKK